MFLIDVYILNIIMCIIIMDLLEKSIMYLLQFFKYKFYDFIRERGDKCIRSRMIIRSLLPSTR